MALADDNNEWHSCLIDPDKEGFYEMRRAPHGVYPADGAEPYMWEGNCWYDLLGEAVMFHPLDGSQWQWRKLSMNYYADDCPSYIIELAEPGSNTRALIGEKL